MDKRTEQVLAMQEIAPECSYHSSEWSNDEYHVSCPGCRESRAYVDNLSSWFEKEKLLKQIHTDTGIDFATLAKYNPIPGCDE